MTPQTEVPMHDQVSTTTSTATVSKALATPKPGFKSSEFTATVAAALAIGSGHIPPDYQPLVAAIVGLYVAARTVLKAVHALGYGKGIPELPDVNLKGLPK